ASHPIFKLQIATIYRNNYVLQHSYPHIRPKSTQYPIPTLPVHHPPDDPSPLSTGHYRPNIRQVSL
ncbi:hypothetical protein BGX38DRAFT_1237038, partial [Terfezia claveryi]